MKKPVLRLMPSCEAPGVRLRSDDGAFAFALESTEHGVFVVREQIAQDSARVAQSALFPDWRSFLRWCEADPVRFKHPVSYVELKRIGERLFQQPP